MLNALTNMIPMINVNLHPMYDITFPISGEPISCIVQPNHYVMPQTIAMVKATILVQWVSTRLIYFEY